MTSLSGSSGLPQEPDIRPESCKVTVRQQPERARVVASGKEKDRKPIDPPPILQFEVTDPYNEICSFLHNPYIFCLCMLYDEKKDEPKERGRDKKLPTLVGSYVSPLYRLKDTENSEGGFFIFSDLGATVIGLGRLFFAVYECRPPPAGQLGEMRFLTSAMSDVFEVSPHKEWEGVKESTALSRIFAEQGVRIRLRKESRTATKSLLTTTTGQSIGSTHAPILPNPTGAAFSPYTGGEQEPPYKRQKSFSSTMSSSYQTTPSFSNPYNTNPHSPFGPGPSQSQDQPPTGYGHAPFSTGGYGHSYPQYGGTQSQYQGYGSVGYSPYQFPQGAPSYQSYQQPPSYAYTPQSYNEPAHHSYHPYGAHSPRAPQRPAPPPSNRPVGPMANPASTPHLPPITIRQGQSDIVTSVEDAQSQQAEQRDSQHQQF